MSLFWEAPACSGPSRSTLAHVADNAQWVVHVDVDALHASTLAEKARKKVLEMHVDAQSHMDRLREKIGMDPGKDLHGLTAYGKEHGKPAGVLIVQAKFDQKLSWTWPRRPRTTRS